MKVTLSKVAMGGDVILPSGREATVVGRTPTDVEVIVEGEKIGKLMRLRRGLVVEDLRRTSPNFTRAERSA